MIAHFRSTVETLDPDLLEATMDIWMMAVEPYPAWAVKRAVANFVRGHTTVANNGAFAPKPPQLAQECEAVLAPFRKNLRRIDSVLDANVDAHVPTEDEKARVAARVDETLAMLRQSVDPRDPLAKRNLNIKDAVSPEELLERMAADVNYKRIVVGEGLRAKLGGGNIDKHCQPSHPEPEEP
jgi:hypothetical protein